MDIPQLATILSSTFDPNLREEAEKKLNEVSVRVTFVHLRAYSITSRDIIRKQKARISLKILCSASQVLRLESRLMDLNKSIVESLFDCAFEQELYMESKKTTWSFGKRHGFNRHESKDNLNEYPCKIF